MIPAVGTYRLTTPGVPPMNVTVKPDGTLVCALDTFDYVPAHGLYRARHLSCAIECTGTGTGFAFVGVAPGFPVVLTCVPVPA